MLSLREPVTNQDAWRLSYINWQLLKKQGPIWKWSYERWQDALLRKHPSGMQQVYKSYFGEQFPLWKYSSSS